MVIISCRRFTAWASDRHDCVLIGKVKGRGEGGGTGAEGEGQEDDEGGRAHDDGAREESLSRN